MFFETDEINIVECSKRLRELRIKNGISHATLATKINVSEQVLKNYEQAYLNNGKATDSPSDKTKAIAGMSIKTLYKLAKYFNVSTDYLLGLPVESTTNKDLNAVCEFTGLSQKTIYQLLELSDGGANISSATPNELLQFINSYNGIYPEYMLETIDMFLSSEHFNTTIINIAKYRMIYEELCNKKSELKDTFERYENDIDWVNETAEELTRSGYFDLLDKSNIYIYKALEETKKAILELTEDVK